MKMTVNGTRSSSSVPAVDTDAKTMAEQSEYVVEKGRELDDYDMTAAEEARMVRKMDIKIFPILVCLYMLSFLDRVNIGKL
jgi:hypothetical protein